VAAIVAQELRRRRQTKARDQASNVPRQRRD
jgi:hypothetical protein